MLNVDGLFRKDDEQPNELTNAQNMQQQMKEFNRLLAKGQIERQEKRSATSCVCCDIGSSPDRLNNVKSPQINCAGRERPQQSDPRISMSLKRYVEYWEQSNSC